jgi:hypothetical protein
MYVWVGIGQILRWQNRAVVAVAAAAVSHGPTMDKGTDVCTPARVAG